ncbi:MAG TPA: DUF1552 domain-containing protein [Polyangiaceae bacterium]
MTPEKTRDLRTKLTRRRLLSGMGALGVALTSPVWRAATVFGQDAVAQGAKRFIGMFSANGTIANDFFPSGPAGTDAPLALGRILAPLAEHVSELLVLRGVNMNSTVENELGVSGALKPGGPHMKGPGAMLTGGSLEAGSFTGSGGPAGYADRISVDQFIANRIGGSTKFASLEFGVRIEGQEPLRVISYRGANQPNTAVDDPFAMYQRIFADANLTETEFQRVKAERLSVLDFLKDDIGRLQARLNAEDRARLEAHLGGVRSIEQRLNAASNDCMPPTVPARFDLRAMENFPTVGKLQMDLMLLAHACDLTRVSTFMWANADSWQYFPWVGVNEEHHELSHAGDSDSAAIEKLVTINAWHAEQVKYVLDYLARTREANGTTLLENTLFLWGNELGSGNTHSYKDIPWLLAGRAGGRLRTGRYLRYSDLPHNDLLVSVCNAMGFDDVTSFGIPGVCTGPLPNLG